MERINAIRYFHYLTLPNNEVDDTIRVYVNALDKAGNPIINTSVFDSAALRLDNVNPTIDILYPVTNSYVSSSSFSYQISEGIKTGSVTWLGTSGGDNNNSYDIAIDPGQLALPNQPHTIPDDNPDAYVMPDLVDGSIYTVTWSMMDTAKNTTVMTSTSVEFDESDPSVDLVYSRYLVGFPYTLTITATFSEPIDPNDVPPQLSIDYQPRGVVNTWDIVDLSLIHI